MTWIDEDEFIACVRQVPRLATDVVGGSILRAKVAAPWSCGAAAGRRREGVAEVRRTGTRSDGVTGTVLSRAGRTPVWRAWVDVLPGWDSKQEFPSAEAAEAAADAALLADGWRLA